MKKLNAIVIKNDLSLAAIEYVDGMHEYIQKKGWHLLCTTETLRPSESVDIQTIAETKADIAAQNYEVKRASRTIRKYEAEQEA